MSNETVVVVCGVDMIVHFDYSAACGDGFNEPMTPSEITINSIMYHDLEMDDMLSAYQIEAIEIQIDEQYNCGLDY